MGTSPYSDLFGITSGVLVAMDHATLNGRPSTVSTMSEERGTRVMATFHMLVCVRLIGPGSVSGPMGA